MKQINTEKAPAAIGPYSQAIRSAAGLVFVSGQLPIDPATGSFPEGGVEAQTRQSLTNARAILREAGLDLCNVVKTTVFLADMGDFERRLFRILPGSVPGPLRRRGEDPAQGRPRRGRVHRRSLIKGKTEKEPAANRSRLFLHFADHPPYLPRTLLTLVSEAATSAAASQRMSREEAPKRKL